MSTFGGKIKEIPDISVDRFDDENLFSLVYFLSHCHTDHMVGLFQQKFLDNLINENKFIYMSEVSCGILIKMYPLIQNHIKILDMYKPTVIMLRDKAISVMPISAGHCPGSLMFLFESDRFILYTGDYRIHPHDIKKLKAFYNSAGKTLTIDKIYLDTTFFLKSYLYFPERKDSLNEMCGIIKDWTDRGSDYIVHLVTSAKYGYENVFKEIYRIIGMPLHVHYDEYQIYSRIPEMDNSVTTNGHLTQIHANCGPGYQQICLYPISEEKLRRIKVSAFRWTRDNLEDSLSRYENGIYYICYSNHASYEEGVEFIRFLKPKSIEPCVKPNDPTTNLEMMQLINDHLMEFNREDHDSDCKNEGLKLLDTNSTCVSRYISNNPSSLESDLLNSPPRENLEDLRRFVRKHSGSFNTEQSEELKIEKSFEFNFEQEFEVDTTYCTKTVQEICTVEEEENYLSTECIKKVNLFETKQNYVVVPKDSETIPLDETESEGSFNEWLHNSPSLEKSFKDTKQDSSKLQNDGIKMHNINTESGSGLLEDLFFCGSSPSKYEKGVDFCIESLNVDEKEKEHKGILSDNTDTDFNALLSSILRDTADDVNDSDYPPTKKFK